MKYNVAVIPGDGIGPDIVTEAVKVLNVVGEKFGHKFEYEYVMAGGSSIDKNGEALPKETLDICKASDAVLLGAVGDQDGIILIQRLDLNKHYWD